MNISPIDWFYVFGTGLVAFMALVAYANRHESRRRHSR